MNDQTTKTVAAIANELLKRAVLCDKTAEKSHLYEFRLKAQGRAMAYRAAAKLVAKQLRRKKQRRRPTEVQFLTKRLAALAEKGVF